MRVVVEWVVRKADVEIIDCNATVWEMLPGKLLVKTLM